MTGKAVVYFWIALAIPACVSRSRFDSVTAANDRAHAELERANDVRRASTADADRSRAESATLRAAFDRTRAERRAEDERRRREMEEHLAHIDTELAVDRSIIEPLLERADTAGTRVSFHGGCLVLMVSNEALFGAGTTLTARGSRWLEAVGRALEPHAQRHVQITLPAIATRDGRSSWEPTFARATAVARAIVRAGIAQERVVVTLTAVPLVIRDPTTSDMTAIVIESTLPARERALLDDAVGNER